MPVENCYRAIGFNIAMWRRTRDMTQVELGEEIGHTHTSIQRIECGEQRVMLHTLYGLARALRVKPELLCNGMWETT